ncbi:FtsX-like permease family protein [Amycolatopsis sp.]|uniref:FtsX-like permease family protein n=1 Tax=Amycolatopsis sp. TaxID=37632 RepID=UPI002E01D726|nr:FtsX-like permease family protein [Amycolatopsis sp.]
MKTVTALWFRGLVRFHPGRLIATSLGIAVAVSLLASLGQFLAGAQATMTQRAAAGVAVDWQVEVQPGADLRQVADLAASTAGVRSALPVSFGTTSGFTVAAGGSTQETGPGKVLGLPPDYRQRFGGEIRTLAGVDAGVLIAQQTAANLHVRPGDTVSIGRAGLPPAEVRIDGVVDLPQADSLFQKVGAPTGSQPVAPPDNVLLLGQTQWDTVFGPLAGSRPDLVTTQLHLALDRALPTSPDNAFTSVLGAAHNFEARAAGAALVGDNLGAALDAARGDAAYARILFLFLGLPAAVLAALLTAEVTAAGTQRRRTDQALLRSRGASGAQVLRLAAVEAAATGVVGSALGLGIAALIGIVAFGSARFGASGAETVAWTGGAAAAGLVIAVLTVVVPAALDWRHATIAASRVHREARRGPLWLRFGLDFVLLGVAVLLLLLAGANQYQLVLAPEGVPSISVSYWAFAAPALLWTGGVLFAWRLAYGVLGPGKRAVAWGLRPLAGELASTVAASMSRRRRPLARSIVLLAVAVAFAISTAVFNSTYEAQAEVDAKLTNGADVAVTESPGTVVPAAQAQRIGAVAGVRSVEPVQHRFAYVGADLQDLYGVRPATIAGVTALQDSYFSGGTARELMDTLAKAPDSILVSAETVKDFQLHPGDQITLRLPDSRTGQQAAVSFHYAGIVSEFPTAPKDSFFVANADYVAQRTGSDAVGAFLVDSGGQDTAGVAQRVRDLVGPTAAVTDISTTRAKVGSSLTAVGLSGLTRVELSFALVLAAGAGGLVLALALNERRRSFAVARALGARRRHVLAFIGGEVSVVAVGGAVAGVALGWVLAEMLASVLTGVFDPPPVALSVPWIYLMGMAVVIVAALAVASALITRLAGRDAVSAFREI